MKQKFIINQRFIVAFSIILGIGLILMAFFLCGRGQNGKQESGQNIKEEGSVQIIRILAHGGYSPRQIFAKAGAPVRIEMETRGTYDCSSVFVIPSLKYQKRLPPTGITIIDVPAQNPGTSLVGLCGMGMYSFEIKFN